MVGVRDEVGVMVIVGGVIMGVRVDVWVMVGLRVMVRVMVGMLVGYGVPVNQFCDCVPIS